MTTLATAPIAPLLERLFEESERTTSPAAAALPREERERLMRSKTDYLDFYGRLKDLWLPVSRETGKLLYMLARGMAARSIVEFGTGSVAICVLLKFLKVACVREAVPPRHGRTSSASRS
jgi:predicted O-methyltransferase YrrM